jgi:DNA-directed RNA polymerase subunit RPC12/RpoP
MDHRCPVCRVDVGKKKLNRAIVAGMAIDCPHCMHKIHLNIHRVEALVVLFNFSAIIVTAAFAYWFQSRGLVLAMLGLAMLGALTLPLLEKTLLRTWPRYLSPDQEAR